MSPPSPKQPLTPSLQINRKHLPKWEKVLWRSQPYPDNYVPPDFLSELNDILPRPRPPFYSLLLACLPISQHISIIAVFLAIFVALLEERVTPEAVGWGCVLGGISGWAIWTWGWGRWGPKQPQDPLIPTPTPLRTLILPPLLLSLLSPVLGTLTSATTSDSIWPLAGGLGFVHLLLVDFRTGEDVRVVRRRERLRKRRGSVGLREIGEEKSLTSSLSLTSALSASVVLASRLPSTAHVFSLILLAVLLFAGWPVVTKSVRETGRAFSFLLTLSTTILALSLFPATPSPFSSVFLGHRLSTPTIVFLSILFLVNFIGPAMLWYAWRWKIRRGGGWDVATVRIRQSRWP
ncbi:phosphatidylinositol glycan, class C [Cryptococcus neoformans C23]|uniref:Phosphatidylinositol glycan, class C n=1 Tax=Cryptococcus neoformans (strain H99 / ATCC 208821 / CBS 10515 / FGSC 9487) TaxID=235443 RepID=J9VZX5_CRYN9|nr:phosphatidylinositol glycan, class C [Cryptococcus neoformans var. grubii H99]AUB29227.1 phosphatidylinositol glycan, class C [Cryptococcus neoformans var. grubii]OWZ25946.1 phosphatidylinositol glycan, class C [Cryptococcus neoformans var. grubii AD2-60a]OWZ26075.1 phosphatidylinositol glycan, class C [Cryptococcus neoformans var. grubii AD1-83a]OWZ37975.1 phosphatidylinositol glycan, class C [Cryptococcus neoformans var. grubii C23]OWZ49718.1 phosphatidylinositol glycan, class C [Cryptoco|eukprot:XP_012053855.1 phosphatidylinositol glycan, class C [Cryptococcus neoformans var. grubii H99]